MSFNALQTITGKVRTRSPFQALSSRYTFLSLREAEPNLGIPGPAGIAPTNDGIRYPVLSNALSGVSAWRVFAYDNPKIAAYSKVNALAIGDNAFVGPTKNSIVYSNYVFGGNRFNSTALADNSFNVYSLSGIYLYNPTTVGDPLSAIAFVVDENGNTGIGIDSPREKLDVIGNARVSGTLSATNLGLFGGVKSNAANASLFTNVRSLSSRWANLLTNKIAIQAYYPGQYAFKDNTFFSMLNDDGTGSTSYAGLKYAAYNFENNKANFYAITAYPIFPIGNDLLDGCSISYHNNKTIVQYTSSTNLVPADRKCYEIYDTTDPFNPVLQKTHLALHDSLYDYYYSSCKLISYSTNTTPVSNYRIRVGVNGKITTLYYNNDLSDVREVYDSTPSYTGGNPYYVNTGATNIYQVSAGLWHLAIYNAPFNDSGFAYNIFKFDNTGRPQNSTGIPFYPPGGANPIDYVCLNSFLSANRLYTFSLDAYVVWVSRFNDVPGAPLTTLQVVNLSAVMASAGLPAVSDYGLSSLWSNIFVAGDFLVLPNLNWYDPYNTYGYGLGADFQLRLKLNSDGTVDVPNSYIVQCNTSMYNGPVLPNFVSTDSNFNIYNACDTSFASKTTRAEITTLQVKDLSFSKCNAIVPATVTDTGKFLTLTVNGEQKAIRLWDYTT
jgi:hypothetical protein